MPYANMNTRFRLTYTIDREEIVTGIYEADGDDFAAVWDAAFTVLETNLLPSDLLKVQGLNILVIPYDVVQ